MQSSQIAQVGFGSCVCPWGYHPRVKTIKTQLKNRVLAHYPSRPKTFDIEMSLMDSTVFWDQGSSHFEAITWEEKPQRAELYRNTELSPKLQNPKFSARNTHTTCNNQSKKDTKILQFRLSFLMFLAMAVLSIAHKNENSVEKQSVGVLTFRIGMPLDDSMKFFVRPRFIPCRKVKGLKKRKD